MPQSVRAYQVKEIEGKSWTDPQKRFSFSESDLVTDMEKSGLTIFQHCFGSDKMMVEDEEARGSGPRWRGSRRIEAIGLLPSSAYLPALCEMNYQRTLYLPRLFEVILASALASVSALTTSTYHVVLVREVNLEEEKVTLCPRSESLWTVYIQHRIRASYLSYPYRSLSHRQGAHPSTHKPSFGRAASAGIIYLLESQWRTHI